MEGLGNKNFLPQLNLEDVGLMCLVHCRQNYVGIGDTMTFTHADITIISIDSISDIVLISVSDQNEMF